MGNASRAWGEEGCQGAGVSVLTARAGGSDWWGQLQPGLPNGPLGSLVAPSQGSVWRECRELSLSLPKL